jgi:hypothetical protein
MRWGQWVLDPSTLVLAHQEPFYYEIDLEEIHSSAAILDWIFHVLGKQWADAETMYDLLRALDDILHPQANYCPWEEDRKADGGKLARAFVAEATETQGSDGRLAGGADQV